MTHHHLQSCLDIILGCTRAITPEAAAKRAGDRWSPVEIVEHLQKAYSGTAKGLDRCLEKGTPLATKATFKQSIQAFALINLGYFPPGRQAPKYIVPTGALGLPQVIEGVTRDLAWLDASATKASQAFGRVKVLDHPILGPLTVEQWLRFHLVHTRHHEKQIRARC